MRLFETQYATYADVHSDRRNLLVHVAMVPVFVAGLAALASGLALLSWPIAVFGLVAMVASMAAQGRGHGLEARPPVPFAGPSDVVARIFAEQLVTFPRFVLSGGFARAWRASAKA
jgi:hypothetical protein